MAEAPVCTICLTATDAGCDPITLMHVDGRSGCVMNTHIQCISRWCIASCVCPLCRGPVFAYRFNDGVVGLFSHVRIDRSPSSTTTELSLHRGVCALCRHSVKLTDSAQTCTQCYRLFHSQHGLGHEYEACREVCPKNICVLCAPCANETAEHSSSDSDVASSSDTTFIDDPSSSDADQEQDEGEDDIDADDSSYPGSESA